PKSRKKFLTVPANVPRFYIAREDLAALNSLLAQGDVEATIHCAMDWQPARTRNLFARLTEGSPPKNASSLDTKPVVFHAYYDSISVTPTLAPGAEQACGAATLLELARYIRNLPGSPPRPIYVLFTGGHGQTLAGMTHFVRRLSDGLERGWTADARGTLIARMGEPGIFVGLDLSTRSDRMGVFCLGHYREQPEGQIRPKFSNLGVKLDEFAKSFLTEYENLSVHTMTSFVDCINLSHGRGWWTFFPYRIPFESELPTLAGLPGVTLATVNDDRRHVDTPDDVEIHQRFDLFEKQIVHKPGERVGLAKIALAFAYWRGPFVSSQLDHTMAKVAGRAVWLDQEIDYTPNRPLRGAAVTYKTYKANKHLMGTRGVPMALTDAEGRFEFDGMMLPATWMRMPIVLEAYGLASKRFTEDNPNARKEYLGVVALSASPAGAIPLDGSVLYGVDCARQGEYPTELLIRKKVEHINLVAFPCKTITLAGLTEPRNFITLYDLVLLDAATESPPFQWGESLSDSWRGDPEENCITIWADPTLRVRLTLGFGFQEKRLILVNNTPEDPIGRGYRLSELETIPSWLLQGARSMWYLDEERVRSFETHGISNPRVHELHEESYQHLERAEAALERRDYQTYRMAAEQGWALESRA
ncbi:MAG TPA: M28 family peptidase, partial [Candidatus Hydrogenedentes bacterium]|nr:M28 family peptidase [Candidatus Hydrogenedentota bacterium]